MCVADPRPLLRLRLAAAAAAAAILAACGGGGGGGSPAPAPTPPPTPTTPLAIGQSNAPPASAITLGMVESAVAMGRWVHEEIQTQRRASSLSGAAGCSVGGVREGTLIDTDGSGSVTAGDRLQLRLTGCWIPLLQSALTGSVDIGIDASTPDASTGTLRIATAGLQFTAAAPASPVNLGGGFAFHVNVTDDVATTRLSALPGAALALQVDVSNRRITETLTPTSIVHSIDLTGARYSLQATATLTSESLVGQVQLTTVSPLVGWAEALPDAGRLLLSGAGNSTVTMTALATQFNKEALLQIDSDGNGATDSQVSLEWNSIFEGYPWWPQARVRDGVPIRPIAAGVILPSLTLLSAPPRVDLPLRPVLQLAFNLPLDPARLPQFRLHRVESFGGFRKDDDWAEPDVVLTAALNGSRLTLSSPSQLQPGRLYALRTRQPGAADDDMAVTVTDVLGRSYRPFIESMQTRVGFIAQVDFALAALPGSDAGDFSLDGRRSREATGSIAGYRWRQISGPPLTLLTPDSPTTVVRLAGPPPSSPATAVVGLTVTNSVGEIDVATLSIELGTTPAPGVSLYFRSRPGSFVGSGTVQQVAASNGTMTAFSFPGSSILQVQWTEASGRNWSYLLSTGGAGPLTLGAFNTGFANFSGDGRGSSWTEHAATIHEISADASGNITRLALDFGVYSDDSQVYGAIRLNSSLPVTRP